MTSDKLDFSRQDKSGYITVKDVYGSVNISIAVTGIGVCSYMLGWEDIKELNNQLKSWLKENKERR